MASYKVVSKARELKTTKRNGEPLTNKDGEPQWNLGVKLEGADVDSDKWYNIYSGDPVQLERIEWKGYIEGKVADSGSVFFLDSVGASPPAHPAQGNGSQAAQQPPRSSQGDDKMRSKEQCMRGEAVQAAASLLGEGSNPEDLFRMADKVTNYIVTGGYVVDESQPPF